jgi:O-antigen ligase
LIASASLRSDVRTIARRPATASGTGRSVMHRATLALVWLTFATSGIVFAEPAPVDVLLIGLVALLPIVGLVTLTPAIAGLLALWLAIAAAGFLAAPFAADPGGAVTHTAITLYLSLAAVVVTAFVVRSPERHARLVLNGLLVAALAATLAGIAGYFALLPGAAELFTRFGRAAGTFKDPNVLGGFLVLPAVYCLHLALERDLHRALLPLAGAALLALGVLLSFSRGAWLSLAVAVLVFGYLSFSLAATTAQRARIAGLAALAIAAMAALTALALQFDSVADLVAERATLAQSYDVGPEGRFGGQAKALQLIAEHPFGIGAKAFAETFHHEEVHNVYLSMTLNAGWLGGGLFIVVNALTLAAGVAALARAGPQRPLLMVALAAFLATALEGAVIDTDHWRHLYVNIALVWGLAIAAGAPAWRRLGVAPGAMRPPRTRRLRA